MKKLIIASFLFAMTSFAHGQTLIEQVRRWAADTSAYVTQPSCAGLRAARLVGSEPEFTEGRCNPTLPSIYSGRVMLDSIVVFHVKPDAPLVRIHFTAIGTDGMDEAQFQSRAGRWLFSGSGSFLERHCSELPELIDNGVIFEAWMHREDAGSPARVVLDSALCERAQRTF